MNSTGISQSPNRCKGYTTRALIAGTRDRMRRIDTEEIEENRHADRLRSF